MKRKTSKTPVEYFPRSVYYLRLSASKKLEKGVDRKAAALLEYHSQVNQLREKFEEPAEIITEKRSGVKDLKALEELVKELDPGSTIYAVRIDRLTRRGPFKLGYIIELAKSRKIKIVTIRDGELTDPKMSLAQQTLASFEATAAAMEHQFICERIRAYIDSCKKEGKPWGIEKAKLNGNFRPGKRVRPVLVLAKDRILQLRSENYTIREISEIVSAEFKEHIGKSSVHDIVSRSDSASRSA